MNETTKHLVLDQNVLRKPVLLTPALDDVRANGELVLLPDMALAEMTKSDQWESTTRASLQLLAQEPLLVGITHALGPLMKKEFDTGEPTRDILDDQVTGAFRKLLREFATADGPTVQHFRSEIDGARKLAADQHFQHRRNKDELAKMVAACRSDLSGNELSAVRNKREDEVRDLLASASMTRTCRDVLVGAGYEERAANTLAFEASISSHEFLAFVATALRWLDSLDSAAEAKITNDLADRDYVVLASFCRGIVSEERNVNAQTERLQGIAERRQRSLNAILAAAQSQT